MKVKSIDIEGIGGINKLHIDFDDNMNFICGPNGIGKTTILECVAHSFSASNTNILKRNVSYESGNFRATVDIGGRDHESIVTIAEFAPEKPTSFQGLHQYAGKLLSLKITRTFQYQPLNAVGKDNVKKTSQMYEEAKHGVNINEIKNWFVNRHLYSAHPGALTEAQIHNLEMAKKSFSLLNEDFSFSRVLASSNEIMVNSPNGEIYYEYLSSGFKSCLSTIFGIIKDIELRFKDEAIKADEFDGIILIDELELHLHPEWQAKIPTILTRVFPKIQFITATHSPHILQSAKPREIIALTLQDSSVSRRELDSSEYGFQGWTVEEVLVDVMGMSDTRTITYQDKLSEFERAIQAEDYNLAKSAVDELDGLLHSDNHLRKLLRLELASIRDAHE